MNPLRCFLPVFALLFCGAISRAAEAVAERVVVIISLDGLAHFYLDDPKADMPTLRALAAQGARAGKMRAVLPTVTWPNHTSIVTGALPVHHGVLGNALFDREKAASTALIWDPVYDKDQIIKVPTIYDVAKQASLKTAAVTWPGSRNAKALDWTVPCVNKSDLFVQYATPSLLPELKAASIPYEDEAGGFKPGHGEERDLDHVRIFNHILSKHRPNLALLHILEVDHVEHAHGPQSPEAYAAVKFADGCVKQVLDTLEADFPGRATVFIVSDHGFRRYSQTVQANVVLRQAGLLAVEGKNITSARIRAAGQGGTTMLYVADTAHREELIQQAISLFEKVEGVETIIPPDKFKDYGFPTAEQDAHAPDLILSAKDGYMFTESLLGNLAVTPKGEERGTHGYEPNLDALHATFIAWGYGIKPGVKIPLMRNIDVAPTAAILLGIEMPQADGHALREILK